MAARHSFSRFARALIGIEDEQPTSTGAGLARWLQDERGAVGEEVLPRFPLARRGYDCASVDEHVWELERELAFLQQETADLRARTASRDEVADEIKRIGEQTSVVLIAAHDQREEILRTARAEADRCVADAKARANAVAAEADARVRELQAQTDVVHRERDRLLEDVHLVSTSLAALAESARERIPPQPEDATPRPEARELASGV